MGEFEKLTVGKINDMNWEVCKPWYANIAKDISTQKKRIGGNFVVAQGVHSQEIRDHIKTQIPECIFVTMTLTKENQKKRIEARHGKNSSKVLEMFCKMHEIYEGPGECEENTYNVEITVDMTPEDVMNKVLEII